MIAGRTLVVGIATMDTESRDFWWNALQLLPTLVHPWKSTDPVPATIDVWLLMLQPRCPLPDWLPYLNARTMLLCSSIRLGLRAAAQIPHPVIITKPLIAGRGLADLLTLVWLMSPASAPLVVEGLPGDKAITPPKTYASTTRG